MLLLSPPSITYTLCGNILIPPFYPSGPLRQSSPLHHNPWPRQDLRLYSHSRSHPRQIHSTSQYRPRRDRRSVGSHGSLRRSIPMQVTTTLVFHPGAGQVRRSPHILDLLRHHEHPHGPGPARAASPHLHQAASPGEPESRHHRLLLDQVIVSLPSSLPDPPFKSFISSNPVSPSQRRGRPSPPNLLPATHQQAITSQQHRSDLRSLAAHPPGPSGPHNLDHSLLLPLA